MSLLVGQQLNRQIRAATATASFPNRVAILIKNDISQAISVHGFVVTIFITAAGVIAPNAVGDSGFRFFCAKNQPDLLDETALFSGANITNIEWEFDANLQGRFTCFPFAFDEPVKLIESGNYVFAVDTLVDTVTIPAVTLATTILTVFGKQGPRENMEFKLQAR